MYRFLSENKLHTFGFHDCRIYDISTIGGSLQWKLGYISVKENNKNNPYNEAMDTDEATITYYNFSYENGKKQYAYGIEEKIWDHSARNINQIINDCDISFGESSEAGKAFFEIIQTDYLFTFNIQYSKVTVEWNEYRGKSWRG